MIAQNLKELVLVNSNPSKDDEYDIPLDITDIISICKEFNQLGWQIQLQIESILEHGVEEAIRIGKVKANALPQIKKFLLAIHSNPYFGDATTQALDGIRLIIEHEDRHKINYVLSAAS